MRDYNLATALRLSLCLLVAACGSSSSNDNNNGLKTDKQLCQEDRYSEACRRIENQAEEAGFTTGGWSDSGRPETDCYCPDGGRIVAYEGMIPVCASTYTENHNSRRAYTSLSMRTGPNGRMRTSMHVNIGRANDHYQETRTTRGVCTTVGQVESGQVNMDITCRNHSDCDFGSQGRLYCDRGYCVE